MKIIKCAWCGKPLRRRYPSQKCHDWCKVEYRKKQSRKTSNNYNKTYKLGKKVLGSSNLGAKSNPDKTKEKEAIDREMRKYKLK